MGLSAEGTGPEPQRGWPGEPSQFRDKRLAEYQCIYPSGVGLLILPASERSLAEMWPGKAPPPPKMPTIARSNRHLDNCYTLPESETETHHKCSPALSAIAKPCQMEYVWQ